MKSGLYARAGASAIARLAACANLLEAPMTKVSKVYLRLRLTSLDDEEFWDSLVK